MDLTKGKNNEYGRMKLWLEVSMQSYEIIFSIYIYPISVPRMKALLHFMCPH